MEHFDVVVWLISAVAGVMPTTVFILALLDI